MIDWWTRLLFSSNARFTLFSCWPIRHLPQTNKFETCNSISFTTANNYWYWQHRHQVVIWEHLITWSMFRDYVYMQGLDRYVCTQIVVRKVIGFYMRSEDVGLSYSSVTGSNSAAASQLQLLNRRSAKRMIWSCIFLLIMLNLGTEYFFSYISYWRIVNRTFMDYTSLREVADDLYSVKISVRNKMESLDVYVHARLKYQHSKSIA